MTELRPSSDLGTLVDRTSGAQPMRRLFHAFNGSALAALITFFTPPKTPTVTILGGAFLFLLTFDLVRLRSTSANRMFFTWFNRLASPREAQGLASSTWYALAMVLVLAIFPWPTAVSGILVMALADPAASYIGRRWGRRPFLGGSVLGFGVFVGVAALILALRTALVAAVAERRSEPLDDNLAVPIVTAGSIVLLQTLL